MEKKNGIIAFSGYMGRKEYILYNAAYFFGTIAVVGSFIFYLNTKETMNIGSTDKLFMNLLSSSNGFIFLGIYLLLLIAMSVSIITLATRRLRDISGEEKVFSNVATILTFITFFIPNLNMLVMLLLAFIPGQMTSPDEAPAMMKNLYLKK